MISRSLNPESGSRKQCHNLVAANLKLQARKGADAEVSKHITHVAALADDTPSTPIEFDLADILVHARMAQPNISSGNV